MRCHSCEVVEGTRRSSMRPALPSGTVTASRSMRRAPRSADSSAARYAARSLAGAGIRSAGRASASNSSGHTTVRSYAMSKGRLEAFSDGVIAILITIMVLELKVPHDGTLHALEPLLPVILSYVL